MPPTLLTNAEGRIVSEAALTRMGHFCFALNSFIFELLFLLWLRLDFMWDFMLIINILNGSFSILWDSESYFDYNMMQIK